MAEPECGCKGVRVYGAGGTVARWHDGALVAVAVRAAKCACAAAYAYLAPRCSRYLVRPRPAPSGTTARRIRAKVPASAGPARRPSLPLHLNDSRQLRARRVVLLSRARGSCARGTTLTGYSAVSQEDRRTRGRTQRCAQELVRVARATDKTELSTRPHA